jgi:hypothetical protein
LVSGTSWTDSSPQATRSPIDQGSVLSSRKDLGLEGGDEVDYVRGVTTAFRASEETPWPRVREFVRDKGIDPSAAVLADFFPDRHRSFLGVIVSADGRAFGWAIMAPTKNARTGV